METKLNFNLFRWPLCNKLSQPSHSNLILSGKINYIYITVYFIYIYKIEHTKCKSLLSIDTIELFIS